MFGIPLAYHFAMPRHPYLAYFGIAARYAKFWAKICHNMFFLDGCKYYNKIVLDTPSRPNAIMRVSFNKRKDCMDENLSWRARLARRNINVLNVDDDRHRWYYEFMYHPYAGQTKWCKTFMDICPVITHDDEDPARWSKVWPTDDVVATELQGQVLNLRKELER